MMMKALLLVASVLALALPVVAQAVTVDIVSDNSWKVYDTNGIELGNAQNVCLNAGAPSNCPQGATIYGYTLPGGWTADLSGTPQATWIWAPNITGASTPADDAEFSFKKDFYICGTPQDSTIWVAADDAANVILNGTSVLSWNSHAAPGSVNILAASLNQSPVPNTIEIKVKNGANPSDCGSGEYRCNPAGVIFKAQFADSLAVLPKCLGNADVGSSIPLCTPPQTGKFRICACVAGAAYWLEAGTCMAPPPTDCASKSVSWIVGASTCDANYPGGQSGTSTTATDFTAPTTGTATASCINGTVTTTAVSCITAPPPVNCASKSVSWTVGSSTCDANYPGGQSGASTTVTDSTAPTTGTATTNCSNSAVTTTAVSCVTTPSVLNNGDICGTTQQGVTGTCPAGTTCKPRLTTRPKPVWCGALAVVRLLSFGTIPMPSECEPVPFQTTDWFCDP